MIESFCPLFLSHAAALLLVGIKAAFFTHGMSRYDLFFYMAVVSLAGGYFATDTTGLLVNVVFNVLFPLVSLRYLGARGVVLSLLTFSFAILTIATYFVLYMMNMK